MQALRGFVCKPFTQKLLFAIKGSQRLRQGPGLGHMPTLAMRSRRRHAHLAVLLPILRYYGVVSS